MNIHTSRFHQHLATRLLTALLGCATCMATRDVDVVTESNEESLHSMENALEVLWSGRPEDKRELVEQAEERFDHLRTAGSEKEAQAVVEQLRTTLRTEKDDWISSRLLQNLAPIDSAALTPVFLDALKSTSPNMRWRALQWFSSHEDPEALLLLEDLWRSEDRPWARGDLIEALAKNGSRQHQDDFEKMASGDDPSLASAAIRALASVHDERTVSSLARLAQEGEEPRASEAVRALASWPESQEALEAVLEASHSDNLDVRHTSITALTEFKLDPANGRLLEMAKPGNDRVTRYAALSALGKLRPPGLASFLVGVLHEPPSEETSGLQSQAIWFLHALDDSSILPQLLDLDFELGGSGFDNLAGLIAHLSRDRATSPKGSVWIRTSCGGVFRGEMDRYLIAPPQGFQSIRCWEYPSVSGDPEDLERIQSGTEVWIQDHFELGKESWVEVYGAEAIACWVPWSQLRRVSEMEEADSAREVSSFRREFDLSFEELHGEIARSLLDSGLLVVIEPGTEVVGAALSLNPEDIEAMPLLVNCYRDDGSILDEQVVALLNALHRRLPEQSTLDSFFAAHPEEEAEEEEVASGEADESTD